MLHSLTLLGLDPCKPQPGSGYQNQTVGFDCGYKSGSRTSPHRLLPADRKLARQLSELLAGARECCLAGGFGRDGIVGLVGSWLLPSDL